MLQIAVKARPMETSQKCWVMSPNVRFHDRTVGDWTAARCQNKSVSGNLEPCEIREGTKPVARAQRGHKILRLARLTRTYAAAEAL
jgi:hypothetical protein